MSTSAEEDPDSFYSDTDAIIRGGGYDDSGSDESMISEPNMSSSSSSDDDDDFQLQKQILTDVDGSGDGIDDLTTSSCASSNWFMNDNDNNNNDTNNQGEVRIFNVDFRALSSKVNSEIEELNLKFGGKRVRDERMKMKMKKF
uniref:Uncharacterized protein n=1 Tax=Solanum lycopersicum TaxID=4081 RepID=A0A3Q7GND8_SOLLC